MAVPNTREISPTIWTFVWDYRSTWWWIVMQLVAVGTLIMSCCNTRQPIKMQHKSYMIKYMTFIPIVVVVAYSLSMNLALSSWIGCIYMCLSQIVCNCWFEKQLWKKICAFVETVVPACVCLWFATPVKIPEYMAVPLYIFVIMFHFVLSQHRQSVFYLVFAFVCTSLTTVHWIVDDHQVDIHLSLAAFLMLSSEWNCLQTIGTLVLAMDIAGLEINKPVGYIDFEGFHQYGLVELISDRSFILPSCILIIMLVEKVQKVYASNLEEEDASIV